MAEKNSNRPNGTSLRNTNEMVEKLKQHENNNPRTNDQFLQAAIDRANMDKDKDKNRKDGRKGGSWNWAG